MQVVTNFPRLIAADSAATVWSSRKRNRLRCARKRRDHGALDLLRSPNLSLSVYPGGHMFYTRADARKQFYRDAKALYETSSVAPQR